jgi:membrane protein implicated in regulation of membrane protease activity
LALNVLWVGSIWGAAVGIILGDVLYFLTDSLVSFLLFIPFALIGFLLARRFLRKWGSVEEYLKGGK